MDLLAAAGSWLAACVLVLLGNVRVVDDLVAAGYGRTPTGSVPDVADHALANSSAWYAELAALERGVAVATSAIERRSRRSR